MEIATLTIPDLIHGKEKMYCPLFCGVCWNGSGRRRARKIKQRYLQHYVRRHLRDDEDK